MDGSEEIKKKLSDNGFSPKEVFLIHRWWKKNACDYNESLQQLKRVFIGCFVMRVILTVLLLSSFLSGDLIRFYSFLAAYVFALFVVEFFAPSITGAKLILKYNKLLI